jgi:hypothetical protein
LQNIRSEWMTATDMVERSWLTNDLTEICLGAVQALTSVLNRVILAQFAGRVGHIALGAAAAMVDRPFIQFLYNLRFS